MVAKEIVVAFEVGVYEEHLLIVEFSVVEWVGFVVVEVYGAVVVVWCIVGAVVFEAYY